MDMNMNEQWLRARVRVWGKRTIPSVWECDKDEDGIVIKETCAAEGNLKEEGIKTTERGRRRIRMEDASGNEKWRKVRNESSVQQ